MMNKLAAPRTALLTTALAISVLLVCAAPAQAHGDVRWSVTVGSPVYVAPPQSVVVYPQSQYIYGAPPSAFGPPPNVVYVAPQPIYQGPPPATLYADPYFYGNVQQAQPYYERRDGYYEHGHGHGNGHRDWRDHDSREPRAQRR